MKKVDAFSNFYIFNLLFLFHLKPDPRKFTNDFLTIATHENISFTNTHKIKRNCNRFSLLQQGVTDIANNNSQMYRHAKY